MLAAKPLLYPLIHCIHMASGNEDLDLARMRLLADPEAAGVLAPRLIRGSGRTIYWGHIAEFIWH